MGFKELMNYYHFDKFPRFVGNPYQKMVSNYEEFFGFMYANSGRNPLFTSINSYFEDKVILDQILFDLDSKQGFDIAFDNLKELYSEFDEYNKVMSFSGTGFHLFLRFEPFISDADNIAVNKFEKKYSNLESLDFQSAEPKHLVRVPSSRYVKRDNVFNRYCIPINKEVLSFSEEKIKKLSEKRVLTYREDNRGKLLYPNEELKEKEKVVYISNTHTDIDLSEIPDDIFEDYIAEIIDRDLFEIMTQNPKPEHKHFYTMALKLKSFGFTLDESVIAFDRLSKYWSGGDKNQKERYYQLRQIYRRDYHVRKL